MDIKINYLYNSGFYIELEHHILIIDYYLDKGTDGKVGIENGTIDIKALPINKKILVLATHSHADHYNPLILKWSGEGREIEYVLSSDIKPTLKSKKVHLINAYEELKLGEITIKTFGSTDLGISFLIEIGGVQLFHAGDLNWWHWWDCTEDENKLMEKNYKREIDLIKQEIIDIAFFPVDPRLREAYSLGGDYFLRQVKPRIFIPMHFGENYGVTTSFYDMEKGLADRIEEIQHRGQQINLKL